MEEHAAGMDKIRNMTWPRPDLNDYMNCVPRLIKNILFNREAADLAETPSERNLYHNIMPCQIMGQVLAAMPSPLWKELPFDAEKAACEGIDFYEFTVCGRVVKANGGSFDNFLCGWYVSL